MSDLLVKRSAIISFNGLYRWRLDREIGGNGPIAAILGVNPSTADAEIDDATIRKDLGFARRLGWSRIIKGNKFAFRATDVNALKTARDPIGWLNDEHLRAMMAEPDIVVAAWGPLSKLPKHLRSRWKAITRMASDLDKPLYCWGVAQDGQPRHPLMLAYATELVEWTPPQ